MTTTFSPFEVKLRREVVAYQIGIGIIVCILMVVAVLMCIFGYLLFERSPNRLTNVEQKLLIKKMLEPHKNTLIEMK